MIDITRFGVRPTQKIANMVVTLLAEERKHICDEIRLKADHSYFGYMGKTEKGYYTIYTGDLERIEKGE